MTTPTCQDIAPLLELYAAGECEPAESARVALHLESCPLCSRSVAELRDLVGLLDLEYRTPAWLAHLDTRLDEVEEERARPRRRRRPAVLRLHRAALSLAALLLVTLGLGGAFPSLTPTPDAPSFPADLESLPAREGMKAQSTDHKPTRGETARAVDALALGLWRSLRDEPGNVVFAPALLHETLCALAAGAGGETATELFALLGKRGGNPRSAALRGRAALWLAEPQRFRPSFLADWSSPERKAGTFNPERSALAQRSVTRWFEQVSSDGSPWRGRLVTRDTRLLLTTVLDWRVPLRAEPAPPLSFHAGGDVALNCPALRWSGAGAWKRDQEITLYELPVPDSELALVFVLGATPEAQRKIEQTWSPAWLAAALREAQRGSLTLHSPRLALSTDTRLRKVLEGAGLRQAFAANADFSGIAPTATFCPLADVAQRTLLTWQPGTASGANPGPGARGVIDRPCLFFVRDRTTGMLHLMGRLATPRP
jgi:hypothetical protein